MCTLRLRGLVVSLQRWEQRLWLQQLSIVFADSSEGLLFSPGGMAACWHGAQARTAGRDAPATSSCRSWARLWHSTARQGMWTR